MTQTTGSPPEAIVVGWTERIVPLTPRAVVAKDALVAARLLRRVLEYPDAALSAWAGVVAAPSGAVALFALRPDAPALPWVDGVIYLGHDPAAPNAALFLPTTLQPTVPAALLHRALRTRFPDVREPLAVWPADDAGGLTLLSLHDARALDRETIAERTRR